MTALWEVRPLLVSALEGGPWEVVPEIPDAVHPPCLVVGWYNPWLDQLTACNYRAAANVMCIANRVTPSTGLESLEEQVSYVIATLAEQLHLGVTVVPAWYQRTYGGVDYLAADVPVIVPVTMAAPALV